MKKKLCDKFSKYAWDDLVFDLVCQLLLILLVIITFYPVYFVVIASFTKPELVNNGEFLFYPKELSMMGYEMVFKDERIWTGYLNTLIYTVGGTFLGTATSMMSGYALSRRDLPGKGFIMKILVFTMYFGGGIIPLFMVVRALGLLNTRFIIIVLGSVSVYNIIVVRSFMISNIPDELFDAAIIDGCGHGNFFTRVVLPMSKAVMAVIVLYVAVGYWNSYFNAMMLLTDSGKYPLQLFLRDMLFTAASTGNVTTNGDGAQLDPELLLELRRRSQVIKYSVIVVATAPILCVYPFIQKYFVKGVMVGAVKG